MTQQTELVQGTQALTINRSGAAQQQNNTDTPQKTERVYLHEVDRTPGLEREVTRTQERAADRAVDRVKRHEAVESPTKTHVRCNDLNFEKEREVGHRHELRETHDCERSPRHKQESETKFETDKTDQRETTRLYKHRNEELPNYTSEHEEKFETERAPDSQAVLKYKHDLIKADQRTTECEERREEKRAPGKQIKLIYEHDLMEAPNNKHEREMKYEKERVAPGVSREIAAPPRSSQPQVLAPAAPRHAAVAEQKPAKEMAAPRPASPEVAAVKPAGGTTHTTAEHFGTVAAAAAVNNSNTNVNKQAPTTASAPPVYSQSNVTDTRRNSNTSVPASPTSDKALVDFHAVRSKDDLQDDTPTLKATAAKPKATTTGPAAPVAKPTANNTAAPSKTVTPAQPLTTAKTPFPEHRRAAAAAPAANNNKHQTQPQDKKKHDEERHCASKCIIQ